jgi:hypothetical protein
MLRGLGALTTIGVMSPLAGCRPTVPVGARVRVGSSRTVGEVGQYIAAE